MGDRSRGLYQKFVITRTDGSSGRGGKHEGCAYFTLDLSHDPHAIPALFAYADSAYQDGYIELAQEIRVAAFRAAQLLPLSMDPPPATTAIATRIPVVNIDEICAVTGLPYTWIEERWPHIDATKGVAMNELPRYLGLPLEFFEEAFERQAATLLGELHLFDAEEHDVRVDAADAGFTIRQWLETLVKAKAGEDDA